MIRLKFLGILLDKHILFIWDVEVLDTKRMYIENVKFIQLYNQQCKLSNDINRKKIG